MLHKIQRKRFVLNKNLGKADPGPEPIRHYGKKSIRAIDAPYKHIKGNRIDFRQMEFYITKKDLNVSKTGVHQRAIFF
jgi:hypothetical protein